MEFQQVVGIALVFVGFGLIFASLMNSGKSEGKVDTKFAVGGFIGFIPFGFANDKRMLLVVLGLAGLIALFLILRTLGKG
ncbi:MAG TPA: hypothetical protein VJB08_00655 [Candidatus Nanoarchaeia archaeon]|nr:hypothetical protein [Candidatus Nanoarchaeia archaeon]